MAPSVAIRWLWQTHGAPSPAKPLPPAVGPCRLCGALDGCYDAPRGVPDTFNDGDLFAAPASPALCRACAWYLGDSRPWRAGNWRITPTHLTRLERADLRPALLGRLAAGRADEDACWCIAPGQAARQKHTHLLRCPVTGAGDAIIRAQVAEGTALVDAGRFPALLAAIDGLLALGHRLGECETGVLRQGSLLRHARWGEARAHLAVLRPYVGGAELALAVYASPQGRGDESAGGTL